MLIGHKGACGWFVMHLKQINIYFTYASTEPFKTHTHKTLQHTAKFTYLFYLYFYFKYIWWKTQTQKCYFRIAED